MENYICANTEHLRPIYAVSFNSSDVLHSFMY
jgi:hypothetical protein